MQKSDKTIYCEYCESFWKRKGDFTIHCKTAKHLKNKNLFLQKVKDDEFSKSVMIPSHVTEIHAIVSEIITMIENMPCPEKIEEVSKSFIDDNPVKIDDSNNQDNINNQDGAIIEDNHKECGNFIKYFYDKIIHIITGSFFASFLYFKFRFIP